MTGMPHPETVSLSMGDHTITGCGGAPVSLLTGRTWVVEDIGGGGLIDSSNVTLSFGTHGRVAGSGGCNRWFAGFELTGESLSIGQAGSTLMACPEALMTQERRFFEALAQVTGFDIDETGALLLTGGDGTLLLARAAD
jgi:heat shock protein HslJ